MARVSPPQMTDRVTAHLEQRLWISGPLLSI
jgi:hypothetical protein